MGSRLSTRFAIGFVAVIVSVFVLLGLYLTNYVRDFELNQLKAHLAGQAWLVADDVRPEIMAQSDADWQTIVERLSQPIDARITIIAADGTVLGDSESSPATMENHAGRPEVVAAMSGEVGFAQRRSETLGRDILYAAVPIRDQGAIVGVARVALPSTEVRSILADIGGAIVTALVVAAIASAALSFLLARFFTRPLTSLTSVTRRLKAGDLAARADDSATGEFAELAASFNEMADELQETIKAISLERSRLEILVEHLADGILIIDGHGNVALMNQAAERLLDLGRSRGLGRQYAEVMRDYELVDLVRLSSTWKRSDNEPPSRFVELGWPRRAVQAFAYPIPASRAEPLVLVVLRDITELRRTEAVRRDFVANVSHDLRTPIASLKALAETLLDGALEDEEVARQFLERMQVEVDDLARLVEELLELSRAESGQIKLNPLPNDIGWLIRRVAARLQAQADAKGVDIELSIPDALPIVAFDQDRIEQVLVNLLHNAVKFTPPGGLVVVGAAHKDGALEVQVRDTGPGLESAELERVFERFYKTDRSRSESGSGLGLAIAKHLIQLHGGRIWVESAYGSGATFTFTLPLAGPH